MLAAEKATRRPSSSLAQPARSTALRARIADTAATASNGSTRAEGGSPASTTALGGEATTAARDNRAIAIAHGNGASAAGNDETITTTTGGIGTSEGTVRDRNQTTASHRGQHHTMCAVSVVCCVRCGQCSLRAVSVVCSVFCVQCLLCTCSVEQLVKGNICLFIFYHSHYSLYIN